MSALNYYSRAQREDIKRLVDTYNARTTMMPNANMMWQYSCPSPELEELKKIKSAFTNLCDWNTVAQALKDLAEKMNP